MRFLAMVLLMLLSWNATANQTLSRPPNTREQTTQSLRFTDAELLEYGFSTQDLATYKDRLTGRAGRWWGHLSPLEMMMYSAVDDAERRRYAKMYLQSSYPKAQAERDAAATMYQVARELFTEQSGKRQFGGRSTKRPALFVSIACEDCKKDVVELVAATDGVMDIYVTNLAVDRPIKDQLISWASSMRLPSSKVTLNEDKGIYLKRFGSPLDRFHLVTQ